MAEGQDSHEESHVLVAAFGIRSLSIEQNTVNARQKYSMTHKQ
jgi:hypothetical protein